MQETVDVTPHPRILRVVADIPFAPWQCIAELVDNALDTFKSCNLQSDASDRRVIVSWSSDNVPAADRQLEVIDTGPGIDLATIQNSVRAGYTSKNATSSLGLFGMGFNIATARLGEKATFLSATEDSPEWVGVEIDFPKLIKSGRFDAPVVRAKKVKSNEHGSKVIVSRLKPTMFAELRRSASQVRSILSDIYAPTLRAYQIEVRVQSKILTPFEHCVWAPHRYVTASRGQETIPARLEIDQELGEGLFDEERNRYLTPEEEDDARREQNETDSLPQGVVTRVRRIHGWLGIQRYPDPNDFGIDFIRNGRKILRRDRSLFDFKNELTGMSELEYPVELSGTVGGRIVGEIHVDYLPPNYQKNDFDRNDPSWYATIEFIRGVGPLRPSKRKALGLDQENNSPIGRLVRGYGECRAGTRYLAAPNQYAREYAREFRKGNPDYLSDEKWWEAAREADRSQSDNMSDKAPQVDPGSKSSDSVSDYLLPINTSNAPVNAPFGTAQSPSNDNALPHPQVMNGASPNSQTITPNTSVNTPPGTTQSLFGDSASPRPQPTNSAPPNSQVAWSRLTAAEPVRKPSLEDSLKDRVRIILADSRSYNYPGCPSPISVKVWEVTTGKIGEGEEDFPCFMVSNANQCDFFYNPRHLFLRAFPTSYKDLLLVNLAQKFRSRDALPQELAVLFSRLVAENFPDLRIDQVTIQESANNFFEKLRDKIPSLLSLREQEVLDRVHEAAGEVEEIATALIYNTDLLHKFQSRSMGGINALSVAPARTLVRLIDDFPEEFFDRKFFRMPYMSINLADPNATERLRNEAKERLLSFLKDAFWVISETRATPYRQQKAELARCSHSLSFLEQEIEN